MAIRLMIHWGSDSVVEAQEDRYKDMYVVWPELPTLFVRQERLKHGDETPAEGLVRMELYRDVDSYRQLQRLSMLSRMRLDEPCYQMDGMYVPSSIQVLHVFTKGGCELPWEWPTHSKSRVWRYTPPDFLDGLPYTLQYHGDTEPVCSKKRRAEHQKSAYKAKVFKPLE